MAVAIDDVADDVGVVVEAIGADGAGGKAVAVRFVAEFFAQAPGLAVAQEIAGILGLEGDDAADAAGPIGVRHRTANDRDILQEFRLDVEGARAVADAPIILAGAVERHHDATILFEAADVDRGCRVVAVHGGGNTGRRAEQVGRRVRLHPLQFGAADVADAGQRVDHRLLDLGGRDGDRVEHGGAVCSGASRRYTRCLGVGCLRRCGLRNRQRQQRQRRTCRELASLIGKIGHRIPLETSIRPAAAPSRDRRTKMENAATKPG